MSAKGILSAVYEEAQQKAALVGVVAVLLLLFSSFKLLTTSNGPPSLPETIPFLTNTLQVSSNPQLFWARALKTMQKLNTEILRFRLAGRPAFLVMGEKKTNVLFRPNSGLSVQFYHDLLVQVMFGPTERDYARFKADVSGRGKVPLPGTEHIAEPDRIWLAWHSIFAEHLLRTKPTNDLAARFFDNFTKKIAELFEVGEWQTIGVTDWVHRWQTDSAARALSGSRVFDMFPEYFDLLRPFELSIIPIAFGPPKWMNAKPHRDRERYIAMNRKFMAEALEGYDWDGPVASSDWEPTFGAPLIRALVRWGLDIGLDSDTIAGIFGIQVLNQNSNAVPASCWALMDLLTCADPDLLREVRAESAAAMTADEETGRRSYDIQRLVASPWLQAVYAETLRLRVQFSVTRDAVRDTEIDGVPVAKGTMVQAPIPIAHYADVWETDGHGPDEFWPRRHLSVVADQTSGGTKASMQFGLGSRSGYWFPYGGGATMCPGRHFAKQEIIGSVALFMTQFEMEVLGWVTLDGKPSDREAKNGVGMAVFQPDRDLKVRIKRLW